MTRLSSSVTRKSRLAAVCLLVLAGASVLIGAASGTTSSAKLSAHLTSKSFTASKAGSVKLVCKFTAPSKHFSYLITRKSGKKWLTVKSVKKTGNFKGSCTTTVKKLFAGKPVKLGSYKLKLTVDKGAKTLSFTVIKVTVIKGVKPANTALPKISGTATQGQTLSASQGSWKNAPTSYGYQWRRCDSSGASCTDISGASSGTYALQAADVGKTARVVVTAKNAYGSASATSSQTAVVAGLPPASTALPAISGTARDGQTLSTSDGTWTGSPAPGLTYQWLRCDASGASCQIISGATANSYTLAGVDDDSTIRSRVTGTNSYGTASASSSQTLPVTAVAKDVSVGESHGCAVLSNGKVACWGRNDYGQLGNNSTSVSPIPVLVKDAGGTGFLTNAVQVSVGEQHSCARLSDGSVWCWGSNDEGELGNNGYTPGPHPLPVQVHGPGNVGFLANATKVSAGRYHTCALLSDQSAWCWGKDSAGQLGDNDNVYKHYPVQVVGSGGAGVLASVANISAGDEQTCAVLSSDHGVWCWGSNYYGQIGPNGGSGSDTPVQVTGIGAADQVSAGYYHTCARLTDTSVWCWGHSYDGQLGNGTLGGGDTSTPVQVVGVGGTGTLTNAERVSVGEWHTCAVLSDHTARCWGYNANGQLGDGSLTGIASPVQVVGTGGTGALSSVTEVDGGGEQTCALLSTGAVTCWGSNFDGQLGIGKIGHSEVPISVSGIADAAGVSSGSEHACAIRSGGTVWCWGRNDYGQLGNGTTTDSSTPVQVEGAGGTGFLTGVTQVSAGAQHTCALVSGGAAYCWGDDEYGQLGDGTTGDSHSLRTTPVQVEGVGGSGSLTGVAKISSGGDHTCALISGAVDCWGNGYSWFPGAITGLTGVTDISAGESHTCAVVAGSSPPTDNTVWCWGWNYYGQLGNGSTADSSSPVEVDTDSSTPLNGVVSVSATFFHTCAVLSGGTADCWGYNAQGQLGHSDETNSLYAEQVYSAGTTPQTGVNAVSAAPYNSCALMSGNTVKCWGSNGYGQLGNGTTSGTDNPTPVSSLSNVIALSAGGDNEDAGEYACALISGGAVDCWGTDYYGELGDGGIGISMAPVGVVGLP